MSDDESDPSSPYPSLIGIPEFMIDTIATIFPNRLHTLYRWFKLWPGVWTRQAAQAAACVSAVCMPIGLMSGDLSKSQRAWRKRVVP